jgi:hypothetical protein
MLLHVKAHALPDPGPGSPAAGIAMTLALAMYAAIGLSAWAFLS